MENIFFKLKNEFLNAFWVKTTPCTGPYNKNGIIEELSNTVGKITQKRVFWGFYTFFLKELTSVQNLNILSQKLANPPQNLALHYLMVCGKSHAVTPKCSQNQLLGHQLYLSTLKLCFREGTKSLSLLTKDMIIPIFSTGSTQQLKTWVKDKLEGMGELKIW